MVDQPEPLSPLTPPPRTPSRSYKPSTVPLVLFPMSPREKDLVAAFRKTIVNHFSDTEEKSPEEILDGLALDLWRLTRK